ncbi:MAG: hypothetical protein JWR35_976 [Marmoricola sp.]|jgi:hypothetical protein|nr:hypothetical protein [Marmoricola sp.]
MPVWRWLVDSAGAVLLLILLYGVLLVVRRRVLSRHGGTFELSVRLAARGKPAQAGRGWVLGLGRYDNSSLQWFRIFSPSARPKLRWTRVELHYISRRDPVDNESFALYDGHVIVECRTPQGNVELAMSPSALTGFQSWLEAAPPGTTRRH